MPVPSRVGEFSKEEASRIISQLMNIVDGMNHSVDLPGQQQNQNTKRGTVATRVRVCLAAKLVYGRIARTADPLLDVESFKSEVMRVYDVLEELEEEANKASSNPDDSVQAEEVDVIEYAASDGRPLLRRDEARV